MRNFTISNYVKLLIPFLRTGIFVCCLAVATAGCSRSPRVTYYTLEPVAQTLNTAATTVFPAVTVGPVTLPEVVDRPQLVLRVAANRVNILETHRWAEPLRSEIPRAIAENLRRLLGSGGVSSYLQHAGTDAEFRVLVDIERFEASPEGIVTVEAAWSLRRVSGGAPINGRSVVQEPVGDGGYESMAAAYGRALLAVSRDLAGAIRTTPQMSN
jgi:uncharacterized protein